jgi:hypothetical protein
MTTSAALPMNMRVDEKVADEIVTAVVPEVDMVPLTI